MITGYTDITYREKGRTRDGCDCWGLIRMVLLEEAGIVLPLHTDIEPAATLAAARAVQRALSSEIWRDVSEEPRQALDVILMRRNYRATGPATHFGIMVTPRMMLQTEEAPGSHLTELRDPGVQCRLAGIVRHRGLS